jgi:hypothetical protein
MTQRMFILSRETLDGYCEEFEVIGTVGSVSNHPFYIHHWN